MKRRAPDGFTLLELLLAVSILSLITASIMGGIHLGRRAWESSRASETLDEVESAIRATVGLVGKAYLPAANLALDITTQPTGPFRGAPDSCRFVALSEGGGQWGGLILTEIGVDNGSEGPELAVWTKPYRPKEGLTPARGQMRKTVILRDLAGLQFSFFGKRQQDAGFAQQGSPPPAWAADWNSRIGMPMLVSVKIAANRMGRVIEVQATVALRQQ
ncbi:MAG: prepilin-type N-terminal cleavage/methylation domain-containing protein [Methylocystis sp.]|jgi:general secretion pathway protein J